MEAIYQQLNAGASCTMKFQIRLYFTRRKRKFYFFSSKQNLLPMLKSWARRLNLFNMQTTRPALKKRDFFKNSNSRKEKSDK